MSGRGKEGEPGGKGLNVFRWRILIQDRQQPLAPKEEKPSSKVVTEETLDKLRAAGKCLDDDTLLRQLHDSIDRTTERTRRELDRKAGYPPVVKDWAKEVNQFTGGEKAQISGALNAALRWGVGSVKDLKGLTQEEIYIMRQVGEVKKNLLLALVGNKK